jgi:hypothetical protein
MGPAAGGGRSGGGGRGRGGRGGRGGGRHAAEVAEIEALEAAIEAGAPAPGTNALSLVSKGAEVRAAAAAAGAALPMAAARNFDQLPLSRATLEGLRGAKYKAMTAIQRAALPHALAGRDVLGAAKTGSGKTLAFLVPVRRGCGVWCGLVAACFLTAPVAACADARALLPVTYCLARAARSSWRSSSACAGLPRTAWAPSCCRPRASWPSKSLTSCGARARRPHGCVRRLRGGCYVFAHLLRALRAPACPRRLPQQVC